MTQPIVYVSGPITAPNQWLAEQNIRRAEEATAALLRLGVTAVCVHSMGRAMGDMLSHTEWMHHDLEILRRCDAVYVCADPAGSKGTIAEIALAKELELPVFTSVAECVGWARSLERKAI